MLLFPLMGHAQFYEPWQLDVQLKMWDSEADVDYLVQNGIPVNFSWEEKDGVVGIAATYLHENNFILLWIQNGNIELQTSTRTWTMSELNEVLGYLPYMPWYTGEIWYNKIVYDIWWNRILIPIGTDASTGQSYAISIYFNSASYSPTTEADFPDEDVVTYYNLAGVAVDPGNAKDQILIKTNGSTSKKILNR